MHLPSLQFACQDWRKATAKMVSKPAFEPKLHAAAESSAFYFMHQTRDSKVESRQCTAMLAYTCSNHRGIQTEALGNWRPKVCAPNYSYNKVIQ